MNWKHKLIIVSIAAVFATTFALLMAHSFIDVDEEEFNAWLNPKDLKGKRIAVNFVQKNWPSDKFTNFSMLISHHAFSFKRDTDEAYTSSASFAWNIVDKIARTQKINLVDQYAAGIRGFDIRVSKTEQGEVTIDHGIAYGSLKQFVDDLKLIGNTSDITVFYRQSRYSPVTFGPKVKNVTDGITPFFAGTNVTLEYQDDWAYADTDDYDTIYSLLDNTTKPVYNLFPTVQTGHVVGIIVGVWVVSFVVLIVLLIGSQKAYETYNQKQSQYSKV